MGDYSTSPSIIWDENASSSWICYIWTYFEWRSCSHNRQRCLLAWGGAQDHLLLLYVKAEPPLSSLTEGGSVGSPLERKKVSLYHPHHYGCAEKDHLQNQHLKDFDWSQRHPHTFSDGRFEQRLPLLEVRGVSSKQQSGAWTGILQTGHGLGHFRKQLQLLGQSLDDHSILLAQPLYEANVRVFREESRLTIWNAISLTSRKL